MRFASYPNFWHLIKRLFKKLKGKKFCESTNSRRTTPGIFSDELIFKQAFFFQLGISSQIGEIWHPTKGCSKGPEKALAVLIVRVELVPFLASSCASTISHFRKK